MEDDHSLIVYSEESWCGRLAYRLRDHSVFGLQRTRETRMVMRAPSDWVLPGQLVEVRESADIAATLDVSGRLDGMPFMPEMARYCGGRFRVARTADTTCVEGLGMRRLSTTVFLTGLRCDGAAHDGCQRSCLMFWKEAWLKPVEADEATRPGAGDAPELQHLSTRDGDRYTCQSTGLAKATTPMSRWNVSPLITQLRRGEIGYDRFALILARMVVNRARKLIGWRELGFLAGTGRKHAKGNLGLRDGEMVLVRSAAEISQSLDATGRNNGLTFEPDMLALSGRCLRVGPPIRKMIHEETGKMIELTSTVALDGVLCSGLHARNCPRANPLFWREAWLKRSETEVTAPKIP